MSNTFAWQKEWEEVQASLLKFLGTRAGKLAKEDVVGRKGIEAVRNELARVPNFSIVVLSAALLGSVGAASKKKAAIAASAFQLFAVFLSLQSGAGQGHAKSNEETHGISIKHFKPFSRPHVAKSVGISLGDVALTLAHELLLSKDMSDAEVIEINLLFTKISQSVYRDLQKDPKNTNEVLLAHAVRFGARVARLTKANEQQLEAATHSFLQQTKKESRFRDSFFFALSIELRDRT